MHIPPNMTESEVLKIIDEVVKGLSASFSFGYFDKEDLQQEGRIWAMETLPEYDSSKGASLKTFIYRFVKLRFINLRRNKYQRPIPADITEEKLEKLIKRNAIKRSLLETVDIHDDDKSFESDDIVQQKELFKLIDKKLPVELRSDYRCILEDVRIPKHRREKVLAALREIVNEREKEG